MPGHFPDRALPAMNRYRLRCSIQLQPAQTPVRSTIAARSASSAQRSGQALEHLEPNARVALPQALEERNTQDPTSVPNMDWRRSNERRGNPFHVCLSGDAQSRFDRQCRRVEGSGCGGLVLVSSTQRLAGHCTLDARAGAFLGAVDFAPPPAALLLRRRPFRGVRLVGVQTAFIQFSMEVTPRVIGEASCVAHDAAIADADAAWRRSAWNKRRRERISSEKRPRRSHRPIERAKREFGGGVKRGKRKRPSTGVWLSKAVSPSGLSEARGWI